MEGRVPHLPEAHRRDVDGGRDPQPSAGAVDAGLADLSILLSRLGDGWWLHASCAHVGVRACRALWGPRFASRFPLLGRRHCDGVLGDRAGACVGAWQEDCRHHHVRPSAGEEQNCGPLLRRRGSLLGRRRRPADRTHRHGRLLILATGRAAATGRARSREHLLHNVWRAGITWPDGATVDGAARRPGSAYSSPPSVFAASLRTSWRRSSTSSAACRYPPSLTRALADSDASFRSRASSPPLRTSAGPSHGSPPPAS